MAGLMKWLLLAPLRLTAALETGDCAFVGIYGDKDDFALVILEDADEQIFLTEETLEGRHHGVSKFVEGKSHVKDAERGTVLRREDFETSDASLLAPVAITAFSGSPSSPTVLCSISLSEKTGASARMLQEMNGITIASDVAQYTGSTSGTKEQLLMDISDSRNWMQGAVLRKLGGFSVAMMGNTTGTMTTPMPPPVNTSQTETTSMNPPPPSSTVPKADADNAAAMGITMGALVLLKLL